jgi:hypothetical protein
MIIKRHSALSYLLCGFICVLSGFAVTTAAHAATSYPVPVTFKIALSNTEFVPGGNVTTTYTIRNGSDRALLFNIGMSDVQDGVAGMPAIVRQPNFKWDDGKGLVWHATIKAHTSKSFTVTTAATTAKSSYCTSVRSVFRYRGSALGKSTDLCASAQG